ncbi:Putative uncharacterized protein [Pararhodospirillum photometricum DSM 122]|uniref:ABC3 transporter permease C-terminal domain-containing protein n=1 Tax=Pararhodospirillum photometricum DSM 122 TaxID=1150469 RepID=H6SRR7_PARPM|nr:Putative uncharacterized protein [Pararhodospirillum photometricum DSM 122]
MRDGVPGAVAAPALAERLGLTVGERLRLGEREVELRALLTAEPDDLSSAFQVGPRLMVDAAVLPDTGLVRPGSLIEYTTLIRLPAATSEAEAKAALAAAHPEAGWRVRGTDEAGVGVQSFLDRLVLFLVLVGLTTLLVGGIGVANAVKAHLDTRLPTLATLKSLGAPVGLVRRVFLLQILLLAGLGVAGGLVVGALVPVALVGALDTLPVPARLGLYPRPLLLAGAFGLLVALVFSLIPLARASAVSPARLFRDSDDDERPPLSWRDRLEVGGIGAALVALIVLSSPDSRLALWFVVGVGVAFWLFRGAAWGVSALARRCPLPVGRATVRLAVTNLHRPGAPTATVVLSLGLGLAVLVAVGLVQRSLDHHLAEGLPARAPAFFFIDLQPDQVAPFRALVAEAAPEAEVQLADMVRGRLQALNGQSVNEQTIAPGARWAVRGDRGFTTAPTLPTGSTLVEGTWWPADYQGPPLFSITTDLAQGMGLKLGDQITVNILGRDITGTLAATRRVDWASLGMNFAFVVSPGAFAGAPRTWIATVHAPPHRLKALEDAVGEGLPNVSILDVRAIVARVGGILDNAGLALRVTAGVCLLTGVLVLIGAFAATHQRRVREAVTLKVLGATRGDLLRVYLLEYGLMGLTAGIIAAGVGVLAAWAILRFGLEIPAVIEPLVVVGLVGVGVGLTIGGGMLGLGRALSTRPGPWLRAD